MCHCKVGDGELLDDVWNNLTTGFTLSRPAAVYRPVGCDECRHTGFRGRTGLYELLTISRDFAGMIKSDNPMQKFRQQSLVDGMKPLRIAGALKISEGVTTVDEVLKITSTFNE